MPHHHHSLTLYNHFAFLTSALSKVSLFPHFSPYSHFAMSPSKLAVFANLALAASAVLIPSTITAEDLGDDNALAALAVNPFKRSVALECPGCPSATLEGESVKWTEGVGSAFVSTPEYLTHSLIANSGINSCSTLKLVLTRTHSISPVIGSIRPHSTNRLGSST